MSTEIKSVMSPRTLTVDAGMGYAGESTTNLTIRAGDGEPTDITVATSDLLAAIEAEGIGVVVDTTGYGVAEMPDGSIKAGKALAEADVTADDLDDIGRCYLALARYRRANPTVDDADVEALAGLLATQEGEHCWTVARHLLASGRVTVTR